MPTVAAAPDPSQQRGDQRPRICSVPPYVSSAGAEVIGLCDEIGLILDPWERLCLTESLGERDDGQWAAFEVGLVSPRQNGKDVVLEARELGGLFLLGERLILHSTHEFKTTIEHFRRVLGWIDNVDMFRRRVKQVRTSHGEEGVELLGGARLRFLARSRGSGRGFSGDLIILNESMILSDASVDALMPTVSARPNPQIWYASSAGDKDLAPCDQLARIRRRALAGGDPSLAYFEWSAELCTEHCPADCTEHDRPDDPRTWAKANPGLGIRISAEHVARERASMSAAGFARERLGVGNYPTDEDDTWEVIAKDAWMALADPASQATGPLAFAADVAPGRAAGAIAVAGRRRDGRLHVEVIDHRPGTRWMVPRLKELADRWQSCATVIDGAGPAGSLIAKAEALDLEIIKPTAREAAQACGQFYDAVADAELVHLDQAPLTAALAGAQKRPLGDAWAWARKGLTVDICPLVAVTLAAWGHATRAHLPPDQIEIDGPLMA